MREVERAAVDGFVPVDRTILVPVRHVAVVDDAEVVGVFMAVGVELCSVEGQTTRDVGGRDGADRHGDRRCGNRDDGRDTDELGLTHRAHSGDFMVASW